MDIQRPSRLCRVSATNGAELALSHIRDCSPGGFSVAVATKEARAFALTACAYGSSLVIPVAPEGREKSMRESHHNFYSVVNFSYCKISFVPVLRWHSARKHKIDARVDIRLVFAQIGFC